MRVRQQTWKIWPVLFAFVCYTVIPASAYQLQLRGSTKLEVSGHDALSLNLHSIEGSQTYYQSDNYGRERKLTNSSNLLVQGDLYKDLYLHATLVADPYATGGLHWFMRYNGNDAKVTVGELSASLPGNEFVLLNRQLTGVQVDSVLPKGNLTALMSAIKSPVRTDVIYGRNVTGPYYLSASPIVDGSAVVTVNDQRKAASEYMLDITNGILNFVPGMPGSIISPTDRITVSYEVATSGAGGGRLYAVRASYPVAPGVDVGVSQLKLKGRGTGSSQGHREEALTSDHSLDGAGTVFSLSNRPVTPYSETIALRYKMNFRRQLVRDTDYTLNYATGVVTLKGMNLTVDYDLWVVYNYIVPGTVIKDRAVTGIDMNWQGARGVSLNVQAAKSTAASPQAATESFVVQPDVPVTQQTFFLSKAPVKAGSEVVSVGAGSPELRLTNSEPSPGYSLDYATGELRILKSTIPLAPFGQPSIFVTYTTAPSSGADNTALAVTAGLNRGKLSTKVGYRKVGTGFSPLEMVGYRNVLRGVNWSANYAPSEALTFSLSGDNVRQPNNPYTVSAAGQPVVDQQNRSFGIDYHKVNGPQLAYHHTTQHARQVSNLPLDAQVGNTSTMDSLSLALNRAPFSANMSLSRTTSDSRQLRDTGMTDLGLIGMSTDPLYRFKGTTTNASVNLGYHPANGRLNVDLIMGANQVNSTTDGMQVKSSGKDAQLNAAYQVSKTLALTTNLQATRTDAAETLAGGQVPGQTLKRVDVGTSWQPTSKVNLSTHYTSDRTEGGLYSNSATKTLSANLLVQPRDGLTLGANWYRQQLNLLGQTGMSQSNMVGANAEIGPFPQLRSPWLRKLSLALDGQYLWGKDSYGVNQLWQSAGVSRQTVVMADTVGATMTTTGNHFSRIAGKVSYQIVPQRQNLFVSGEAVQSGGSASSSRKGSLGLGWNYHINENLVFTLDAQRVIYADKAYQQQNYKANQLNAKLDWQF